MATTSSRFVPPQVCAVLGAQWGDEGKGKIVDALGQHYDICARFNGGANAGHTIVVPGIGKFAFHLLPSGILQDKAVSVIGNGVVLYIPTMMEELAALEAKNIEYRNKLKISDRAHITFEYHRILDRSGERELGSKQIGTTGRGIGPTYSEKMSRTGIRVGELRLLLNPETAPKFVEKLTANVAAAKRRFGDFPYNVEEEVQKYTQYARQLEPWIVDTVDYINDAFESGKKILIEGANATMLDIDFGTYPYVTSSSPNVGGITTGLGLSAARVAAGAVIGVVKAYTTRVGAGPFPTQLNDAIGEHLCTVGHEYGTTTGRKRACGWLDMVVVRYTHRINGYTHINLTKLDVLTGLAEVKIGVAYVTPDGRRLTASMPAAADDLAKVTVEYETLPGWKEDITNVREYEDLPENCRRYVERIEQLLKVPIVWIGVGPARDANVVKP